MDINNFLIGFDVKRLEQLMQRYHVLGVKV